MIKKYKYFFITLLLALLSFVTIYTVNDSITAFNIQQNQYDDNVTKFIQEIYRVQDKNPINADALKTDGEMYTYNALTERVNVLNIYMYTEDKVPAEYIDIHHRLVEFITMYREGVVIAKEGIMLMNTDRVAEGISKITSANELLVKIKEDLSLMQGASNN